MHNPVIHNSLQVKKENHKWEGKNLSKLWLPACKLQQTRSTFNGRGQLTFLIHRPDVEIVFNLTVQDIQPYILAAGQCGLHATNSPRGLISRLTCRQPFHCAVLVLEVLYGAASGQFARRHF